MKLVTVFTPTYNRGHLLGRLYESLKAQSDRRFEWLIVDDGSTDDTADIVAPWLAQKELPVTYIRTENGGKHRAINHGISIAHGEIFFIVDSDDWLAPNAIERIFYWENSIAGEKNFAGVAGLKCSATGEMLGQTFSEEFLDATSLERKKYKIIGDKSEAFYTEILKKYPFPEFEGENFLTESVVWERIAHDGYKIRWFNEPIYYCEQGADGLTAQGRGIFARNPKGYALFVQQTMVFYHQTFREQMYSIYYYYMDVKKRYSMAEVARFLNVGIWKVCIIFWWQQLKINIKKLLR